MSILEEIVAWKKKEVKSCKELIPLSNLKNHDYYKRSSFNMKEFLLDTTRTGIIAEFKRRSPSKGIINDKVLVEKVTSGYEKAGASAISVLTDFNFFGGSADDLLKARNVNPIPILRKEFIIDTYQIHEAKAIGADAILLIAAILTKKEAEELATLAHDLGMQVLMEFHDEQELDLLNDAVDMAGVNNRNLKTFEVSLQHSADLTTKIPGSFLKISESGISSPDDILFLRKHGYQGFLIGENFMKTSHPEEAFTSFVDALRKNKYDQKKN